MESIKHSAADICNIIRACNKNGIRYFRDGDLEFYSNISDEVNEARQIGVAPMAESELEFEPENPPKKIEEDMDAAQEAIQEYELENLMLSDPVEYERLRTINV